MLSDLLLSCGEPIQPISDSIADEQRDEVQETGDDHETAGGLQNAFYSEVYVGWGRESRGVEGKCRDLQG
jgi:hypothetical protein